MAATSADDYTRGYMCSRAIVSPTGNVFWPPPTKLRSTCEVDVTYFPFDDQTCKMKLGSWIYDGHQVNILNRTENVDLNNYVHNGEWDLIATKLVRNVVYYPCCLEPFPDVTITLVIRRKILYYLYNVILPCIMMSALTLLVFCLPPESGEKIALGVTVLLAFSVFMLAISEKLPETSESIPLLGAYLTVVMGITSVSIVMTVVVLNFHYISPLNRQPLPLWIKRLAINESNLCTGLPAPFDEFCTRYYKKAKSNKTANCCSASTLDNTNEHKLDKHMGKSVRAGGGHCNMVNSVDKSSRRTNSANERGNCCESTYQCTPKKHFQTAHQQFDHQQSPQPALFSKSGRRVSKSKWMGQVDRLAASFFSGAGVVSGSGVASSKNKVHSSELCHASAECTDALQRKASAAPSGNWGHALASAARQTLPEKETLGTGEAGYYNCPAAKMEASNGKSSAVQDSQFHRPRTSSAIEKSSISDLSRDQLQRSTMLSNITPYLLCAASRVIESNRQPSPIECDHLQCRLANNSLNNDRLRLQHSRSHREHSAMVSSYSHHSLGDVQAEPTDEEEEVEEEIPDVYPYSDRPHYHDGLSYRQKVQNPPNEFASAASPPFAPSSRNCHHEQADAGEEVMIMLRYLMHRQETEDNVTRRIHEWRQLSMFIDKILFWIFTIVTVFTSCIFLLFIPIMRRGF